jgi:hypothetical protein
MRFYYKSSAYIVLFGLGAFCLLGATLSQGNPTGENKREQQEFEKQVQPFLEKYCTLCHGEVSPRGGVNLKSVKNAEALHKDEKAWRKLVQMVKEQTMPPPGASSPKFEQREAFVKWVTEALNNSPANSASSNPGRVVLHRLNRAEYNNTVRDLFGVTSKPADTFPADGGGGGGFDNNADTLFLPPVLLERYLVAAGDILEEAKPERLFFIKPTPKLPARDAAQRILAYFAYRAYRRPVETTEVTGLMNLYDAAKKRGDSHEKAIKYALKVVLVSPNFLFRMEQNRPTGQPYLVSDFELASRVSYFLWASTPDDTLLGLAKRNRLRDPEVLDAQIKRMLASPKSKAFSESFASQWLKVKDLYTSAKPDPNRFPNYSNALRDAMYQEPIQFFDSVVRENGSLLQLLDSQYTFVNAELAKHYGIDGIAGNDMRRVRLTDRRRGGVTTMASVLTLTSYPLRTSPVLRGKYIMEQIMGSEIPPPPPVVATLSQDDAPNKEGLTFRQRLEQHRTKPDCAGCHSRMDPLGFGLENFDAVGKWRDNIGNKPIDASGEMTSGEKFAGAYEMKQILLARKDEFIRNLSEKMLSYALGRGLEPYDGAAVRKIVETVRRSNYSSQSLIREVIVSFPFQYRNSDAKLARRD